MPTFLVKTSMTSISHGQTAFAVRDGRVTLPAGEWYQNLVDIGWLEEVKEARRNLDEGMRQDIPPIPPVVEAVAVLEPVQPHVQAVSEAPSLEQLAEAEGAAVVAPPPVVAPPVKRTRKKSAA